MTGLADSRASSNDVAPAFAGHDIRLESARLLLRPFTHDDMKAALPLYQDPEVSRAMEGDSDTLIDPCYLERAWEYLARHGYLFAVVEKSAGRVIGELCLEWMNLTRAAVQPGERVMRMPLDIWDKNCWSRGYGKEMVTVAADYAFEVIGVDRLCAMDIHPTNWRSRKLFESCGFVLARELGDGAVDLEIVRQAWLLRKTQRR
jgi:RimJ/RimL family protein N-acetyltransferase